MCIFSMMIDYKFRTYQGNKHPNKERAKLSTIGDYFDFYRQETKKSFAGVYKDYVKALRAYSENAKL